MAEVQTGSGGSGILALVWLSDNIEVVIGIHNHLTMSLRSSEHSAFSHESEARLMRCQGSWDFMNSMYLLRWHHNHVSRDTVAAAILGGQSSPLLLSLSRGTLVFSLPLEREKPSLTGSSQPDTE